jgi:hypothetical protein
MNKVKLTPRTVEPVVRKTSISLADLHEEEQLTELHEEQLTGIFGGVDELCHYNVVTKNSQTGWGSIFDRNQWYSGELKEEEKFELS